MARACVEPIMEALLRIFISCAADNAGNVYTVEWLWFEDKDG